MAFKQLGELPTEPAHITTKGAVDVVAAEVPWTGTAEEYEALRPSILSTDRRIYVTKGAGQVSRMYIGAGEQVWEASGTPGSSTVVGALRVTDPTVQGANVAGDLYLEAEIAGATAVEFQVGHFDWPRYPATLVSGNLWRSDAPWKSALSITDGVTPRPNDFPAYIITHATVSGSTVVSDEVEVLTLNHPDIVGITPVWRPELEFTSNLSGTDADYYASFHTTWGTANNPDGTPVAKIINAPTAIGKMVNIYMPDDHTTADQPNSNLRWQMQTRPELRNGDEVWIGYSYRIPADTTLFGTPTSSHISISQLMGADAADSYDLGLRMMYQARTKTSVSGYTDQLTDNFHISMSDGRYAEPELTFQLPFYRGEIVDMVYGYGVATTPQEGWMEIRYRIPGNTELTRHEFFGIPGKYRIPVALIDKNGVGQRFDQHIYRGRNKFPVVSMDFGQLKIRATPEEADPKSNILTLMQESFNGATGGAAMSTTNTTADIVTTGANNTLTLDAGKFIATLGITNGSFADWLLTAPQSGRTIVRIEKFEFSVASSFRPLVFRGSSGNLGHWRVNSSGTLELLSATGVGVATTTTTMTPNTLYDVEVAISPGTTTTDGVLELRYALAGSSASIGAPLIATGVDAGATPLLRHRLGTSSPASVAVVFKVDHVSVRALTTGWIGFTSEEVAPSEPGAPQVVGTSTVAPVGNQNLTPGNSTVILAAPTGLAIGDYYFYTATISSLNATNLSFPAQPGFTVFSVDSGTTADEAIALVGRPIVNQADLDDAQLVTIEAGATTGRVVAHGVALRNIDMTAPFVGIGAFTTLSGGANDKTTIGFAAPPAGGFSVGVVSSYTSGTGGVTTYASVGGSMIVEGVATAQVDPNASSSNSLGVFTSGTTSVSTVGRSAFDITTVGITFNAAGTAPPPSGTATEGLAYDITASSANRTTKKVFGHYFPPNPISYDNDPLTSLDPTEYWRVNMTNAVPGESGKHTRWGSFSRNRPLYRDPKPSGWQVSDMKEEIRQAFTTGLDGFVINTMGLSGANWIRNTELIQACNESHPTGDFWVNIMIDVASPNMASANVDTIADRIAYFAWTDMNTPDTGAWSKSATSVLRASAHFLPDGRYLVGGYNVANKTAAWWDSIFVSLSTRYGLNGALLGAYAAASQTANYDGYSWSYGGGDWATAADPTVAANRSLSSWASIKSAGRALLCGVSSQGVRVNSVHGYKYDEFGNITGPRFYPIFDESVGLEAMIAQWENVITADADYVQLVTWNDYSEGAEFGWSTLGGSVNTDVSAYFAHWWKTGVQPDILEDVIYLSHRDQFATNPGTNQRAFLTTTGTNQEYFFGQWERGTEHPVVNVVEAVSFLTAAATVTVTVGGVVTTYTAQAGLHRQEVPLGTGTVSADVVRGGVSVASLTSPFQVLSAPIKDNPHYCKSSSKRPAVTAGQFNPQTQPGAN